jgi:hypothetical protein
MAPRARLLLAALLASAIPLLSLAAPTKPEVGSYNAGYP